MNKKHIIISSLSVLVMSIIFGYSLVFGDASTYNGPTKIEYTSGNNIYTGDLELNTTHILFTSGVDLENVKISSSCDIFSDLIYKGKNKYYFELKYFTECRDNIIEMDYNGETIFTGNVNIVSDFQLYDKFIDYSTPDLKNIQIFLSKKIYSQTQKQNIGNILEQKKEDRTLQELRYIQGFIQKILQSRSEKYLVPVEGYNISTKHSRVPNTGRPYRESYTHGIHHGWDVGSKLGETVRALDEGIIIRVVEGFKFSDLDQIVYGDNLTDNEKLLNLDVLRGNQVWLKTSKGDVVFYSHLQDIAEQIEVGSVVTRGETLGTTGISGVPEKGYTDYHLHFEIYKNPYTKKNGQEYSFLDYMKWDWYFKGQSVSEVLKYQDKVFKAEY